jgi:transcriptional regulator with XRE-family HTH domain
MGRSSVPPALVTLATRLKAAREHKHLTLQEVYDLTGIHVGRLEANRANMTVLTLLTLCSFYEVQPADIIRDLEVKNGVV